MSAPQLPDAAARVLQGVVTSLHSAGLITGADAKAVAELLDLRNAFFNLDASREIDRLTAENERLRHE